MQPVWEGGFVGSIGKRAVPDLRNDGTVLLWKQLDQRAFQATIVLSYRKDKNGFYEMPGLPARLETPYRTCPRLARCLETVRLIQSRHFRACRCSMMLHSPAGLILGMDVGYLAMDAIVLHRLCSSVWRYLCPGFYSNEYTSVQIRVPCKLENNVNRPVLRT